MRLHRVHRLTWSSPSSPLLPPSFFRDSFFLSLSGMRRAGEMRRISSECDFGLLPFSPSSPF